MLQWLRKKNPPEYSMDFHVRIIHILRPGWKTKKKLWKCFWSKKCEQFNEYYNGFWLKFAFKSTQTSLSMNQRLKILRHWVMCFCLVYLRASGAYQIRYKLFVTATIIIWMDFISKSIHHHQCLCWFNMHRHSNKVSIATLRRSVQLH